MFLAIFLTVLCIVSVPLSAVLFALYTGVCGAAMSARVGIGWAGAITWFVCLILHMVAFCALVTWCVYAWKVV